MAMTAVADPASRLFDDQDQSAEERCEVLVGFSDRRRLRTMAVAFIFGHARSKAVPVFPQARIAEAAMTAKKSVLVVGLDPVLIDFSTPGYLPGMDATKVLAGLKSSEDELTRLGYSVEMCLTDLGETAAAVVESQLTQKRFDCILIGAGVRANPSNFMLFEKLINVVHEHAPQARICFNTVPSDTAAAVKRWL